MDLTPLKINLIFDSADNSSSELGCLGGEKNEILASHLFTASEHERGTVRFMVPSHFKLEHLTKNILLKVCVKDSGTLGLRLKVEEDDPAMLLRWSQLLEYLKYHLGRNSRFHPRFNVLDLEMGVEFPDEISDKWKVFDISTGGMKVVSDLDLTLGKNVKFQIYIPPELNPPASLRLLEGQGVVQNRQIRGIGIQFKDKEPFSTQIDELIQFIAKSTVKRLRYPRYSVFDENLFPILYFSKDNQPLHETVQLKDVSITGCYIIINRALPLNEKVDLMLPEVREYKSLTPPYSLSGHIIRAMPDGLAIRFSDLSSEISERHKVWISELASRFSLVNAEIPIKPKATLSINYANDMLFVREYLYSLSAGGLFLAGNYSLAKGDSVEFVLDLSEIESAKQMGEPFHFMAKVVRTNDQGIGVQFVDPEAVRRRLDGMVSDLYRKHIKNEDSLQKYEQELKESDISSKDKPINLRRVSYLIRAGLVLALGVLIYWGVDIYLSRTNVLQPASDERIATPSELQMVTSLPFKTEQGVVTIDINQVRFISVDSAKKMFLIHTTKETLEVPFSGINSLPPIFREQMETLQKALLPSEKEGGEIRKDNK